MKHSYRTIWTLNSKSKSYDWMAIWWNNWNKKSSSTIMFYVLSICRVGISWPSTIMGWLLITFIFDSKKLIFILKMS